MNNWITVLLLQSITPTLPKLKLKFQAKENLKYLRQLLEQADVEKILEILNAQKKKKAVIKKEVSLTTKERDGLKRIKDLLSDIQDVGVKYIAAGRYSLKTESKDIKTADQNLTKTLEELEKKAKKQKVEFSIVKK